MQGEKERLLRLEPAKEATVALARRRPRPGAGTHPLRRSFDDPKPRDPITRACLYMVKPRSTKYGGM